MTEKKKIVKKKKTKKREKLIILDMSFDEALERLSKVKPENIKEK